MCWDLSDNSLPSGPKAQSGRSPWDAAMQQIADWLEKLGMSEYAQRFAENGFLGVIIFAGSG
jgi:hypothetical protein